MFHLDLGCYKTRQETRQHKAKLIPTPIFKKKTGQTDRAHYYLVTVTLVIVPGTYFSNFLREGGHKTGTASRPDS